MEGGEGRGVGGDERRRRRRRERVRKDRFWEVFSVSEDGSGRLMADR